MSFLTSSGCFKQVKSATNVELSSTSIGRALATFDVSMLGFSKISIIRVAVYLGEGRSNIGTPKEFLRYINEHHAVYQKVH